MVYEKKFLPGRLIKSRMTVLQYTCIFFFWLSPKVESICTSLVQHDVAYRLRQKLLIWASLRLKMDVSHIVEFLSSSMFVAEIVEMVVLQKKAHKTHF